jgi:hypothetical protein
LTIFSCIVTATAIGVNEQFVLINTLSKSTSTLAPATTGEKEAEIRCHSYHAVTIEIVSTQSLCKTGIFRRRAGDFGQILVEVAGFRRLETDPKRPKSP